MYALNADADTRRGGLSIRLYRLR